MDETTQLKLRIMSLEQQQNKTTNFLKKLCQELNKKEMFLSDEIKLAIKKYLDIFEK